VHSSDETGQLPHRRSRAWLVGCLAAALVAFALPATAADQDLPDQVVVTATRSPQSAMDVAASVDRIDAERIHDGQLQVNLSESLSAVAGVNAASRQNYAQDLQLSVRGFGARSAFGVRGIRLYTDGIPATMPDGQGQVSHFDLGSIDHIEVLRGPYSALYGNSSGGVIAAYTADPPQQPRVDASLAAGSLGVRRIQAAMLGEFAGGGGVIDASHFETDGYRRHSAAQRDTFNARMQWQLGASTHLALTGNALDSPLAQDPLGLKRAQLAQDPRQAGDNALKYNARKSVSQQQLGAELRHEAGNLGQFTLMAYGGHRATIQFQATPQASQGSPRHPGGVVDLDRNYRGADLRWQLDRDRQAGAWRLVTGLAYDGLDEQRRGYLNFDGDLLGVQGELRRNEANRVYDFDQYAQLQWQAKGGWNALAGLRHSSVAVRSDNFHGAAAGTESSVRYSATTPVAGLTLPLHHGLNAYAAYGRGFETPTLNELAYRSTNGSLQGLNIALRPSRSDSEEIGLKLRQPLWSAQLAGFRTRATDELAVLANASGRSVYTNIPETLRRGIELSLRSAGDRALSGELAWTSLDATVEHDYQSCTGLPCSAVTITRGSNLPAVPRQSLYAGLTGRLPGHGLAATFEALHRDRIYVNDLNSDAADGYWVANLHVDFTQVSARWRLEESLRIDNLFDRAYVGSVIVNESNSRFFEPAPGRTVYLLLRLSCLGSR
jgi:iron complex outermembrane receptor protein